VLVFVLYIALEELSGLERPFCDDCPLQAREDGMEKFRDFLVRKIKSTISHKFRSKAATTFSQRHHLFL